MWPSVRDCLDRGVESHLRVLTGGQHCCGGMVRVHDWVSQERRGRYAAGAHRRTVCWRDNQSSSGSDHLRCGWTADRRHKESTTLNAVLVVVKIIALSVFVVIALPHFDMAHLKPFMPYGFIKSIDTGGVERGVMAAAAIIFCFLWFRCNLHRSRGN